ncbi:MAG: nitronate monooxygenase [Bdellovibrionota bacterium]
MSQNNFTWPQTRITKLFNIDAPIVQAGMVWVSGAKLAAAAANNGCLGLIGAGSMAPDLLRDHIRKAKTLTNKSFGVNVPLLYEKTKEQIQVALDEGVKIFFTSAGSPKTWTSLLKKEGCIVVHVTSTPELAKKCEDAGVDAVVVEGFEAGGHNGRDEITSLVLLQQVYKTLSIPVIAAGGFGSGQSILAALVLGAEAVQIGTLFAAVEESSAHQNFKNFMCNASHNSTFLRMKKLVPVRLLENEFAKTVANAEEKCASKEELQQLLGKGRAKQGMLLGDLQEGELEVGQIVSQIHEVMSCSQLVEKLKEEFVQAYSLNFKK